MADRLIQVEFEERRKILARSVLQIAQRFSSRGALLSSMHLDQVVDACEKEIDIRARLIFQIHARVLADLAIKAEESLAEDLKERLRYYLPHRDDYTDHAEKVASKINMVGRLHDLANKREQALKRTEAEIDLYVLGQVRRAKELATHPSQGAVYNFLNSPVGAFQVGAGSVTTVAQTIQTNDRDVLITALEFLKERIEKEAIVPFNKQEILELIDDSKKEAQRDRPNGRRLAALMNTISSAVQLVGSLNEAYQAVKGALLPFGIMLP